MSASSTAPSRRGRILVVDDLEPWRLELQRGLGSAGFDVDVASTIAEAKTRLDSNLYHVLVLDLRLKDHDLENVEGMTWLRELGAGGERKPPFQILMISAYGTPAQMREAFADYGVADFIDKAQFKESAFIERIRRSVNAVGINLALDIRWQDCSPQDAVLGLLSDDSSQGIRGQGKALRIKADSPKRQGLALELEDLLCRLFNEAESIIVSPLQSGHSGAGVLSVQPFLEGAGKGKARRVVVKFGMTALIGREYERYSEFVKPFLGQGRSTQAERFARTPQLGGIVYTFVGTEVDALVDFEHYFHDRSQEEIDQVLYRLVAETCGPWYDNRERVRPHDLAATYRTTLTLDEEKLDKIRIEQLRNVQGAEELTFSALNRTEKLPNPILFMRQRQLTYPASTCVGHGDLSARNILIGADGHAWLIDFLHTGVAHVMNDMARLDTIVRTQLLGAEEATLQERLEMEEALASVNRFSQLDRLAERTTLANPAVAKAFRTSVQLRRVAGQGPGAQDSDDMSGFFVGCVYHGMNTIRYYSLPRVQREHGLLSAAVLVRQFAH
jgi:CheY-like chemotaxis protein